jgi:hypothetical protein
MGILHALVGLALATSFLYGAYRITTWRTR